MQCQTDPLFLFPLHAWPYQKTQIWKLNGGIYKKLISSPIKARVSDFTTAAIGHASDGEAPLTPPTAMLP